MAKSQCEFVRVCACSVRNCTALLTIYIFTPLLRVLLYVCVLLCVSGQLLWLLVWFNSSLKMFVGRWLLCYLFVSFTESPVKLGKCLSQLAILWPADRCNAALNIFFIFRALGVLLTYNNIHFKKKTQSDTHQRVGDLWRAVMLSFEQVKASFIVFI